MKTVLLVALLLAAALVVSAQEQERPCPTLYDGNTKGLYDQKTQMSTNVLQANWKHLSTDAILIEMCVVTGAQAGKIMEAESCRENPGFTGLPNVVGWAEMSLTSNSAEWTNLALERGQTYVVVMRIFYNDGSSAYTNSDGVTVVPEELVSKLSEKKDVKRLGERSVNVERALGASVVSTLQGGSCSIDQANRCRQSQVKVGDQLEFIYGPPEWRTQLLPFRTPEETYAALRRFTGFVDPDKSTPTKIPKNWEELQAEIEAGRLIPYVDNHHDDDSSEMTSSASPAIPGGAAAGIAIGVILLLLLLLLLLAALLFMIFGRGGEDEKWSEPEARREPVGGEASSAAAPDEGPDNTRVEFPDIDPGARLSVAS